MGIASEEIRRLALRAYETGEHPEAIARVLGVGESSVWRWILQSRSGQLGPRPRGHKARALSPEQERQLDELVRQRPDLTLEELRDALTLTCHISTIHRALARLGYRYKKKRFLDARRGNQLS